MTKKIKPPAGWPAGKPWTEKEAAEVARQAVAKKRALENVWDGPMVGSFTQDQIALRIEAHHSYYNVV